MKKQEKKRRLKLNQKIYVYTTVAFLLFSCVLLSVTILLLQQESNKNSIRAEQETIQREADDLSQAIASYINLSYALSLSPSVQEFLSQTETKGEVYYNRKDIARSSAKSICEADSNICFLTIFDYNIDDYIFACTNHSLKTVEPKVSYFSDAPYQIPFNNSSFTLSFTQSYFPKENPYLNIYFPINSACVLNKTIGYLCLALKNQTLQNIIDNKSSQMVISQEGKILASSLGNDVQIEYLTGNRGYYKNGGTYYFYHKVDGTTLFLVDSLNSHLITGLVPEISLPLVLLITIFIVLFLFTQVSQKKFGSNLRFLTNS